MKTKRVKVAYYGLINEIPPEGIEVEGETIMLPFSPGEPPYYRTNADGTIDFTDWIAILEEVEDDDDHASR